MIGKMLTVGKDYYFRGVVYSMIGCVVDIDIEHGIIHLGQASYVGTDGRFAAFVGGDYSGAELEYVGEWYMRLDAVNDFGVLEGELPTATQ